MKFNLQDTFTDKPVPASITVAEIKGTEHPDERVIIGGHLDSWDLGQGALDNGTGAMATLEAARTLQALGWKPKRTITFILFTGEEQGGIGADTFVKNHAAEMAKIDAVLIHDTGTGKVFSIALENLWETAPLMSEIYQPLQEVFDLQPLSTRYFGSSDHVSFSEKGSAGVFLRAASGALSRGASQPDRHLRQGDSRPDQRGRGVACGVGLERVRDAGGVAASIFGGGNRRVNIAARLGEPRLELGLGPLFAIRLFKHATEITHAANSNSQKNNLRRPVLR